MHKVFTVLNQYQDKNIINLILLRSLLIGFLLIMLSLAKFCLGYTVPLGALYGIFILWMGLNLGYWLGYQKWRNWFQNDRFLGVQLSSDLWILFGVLSLTGGVHNPFAGLFLVFVLPAVLMLSIRWVYWLLFLSGMLYGVLMRYYVPLVHPGGHHAMMENHLEGMVLGYLVLALFIGGVLIQIKQNLDRSNQDQRALMARLDREEWLGKMGLLAATAAHDMRTPLNTIAVISEQLDAEPQLAIQQQVQRIQDSLRDILDHHVIQPMTHNSFEDYMRDLLDNWRQMNLHIRLKSNLWVEEKTRFETNHGFSKAILGFLDNASNAQANTIIVQVNLSTDLSIDINDDGVGMPAPIADALNTQDYPTLKTVGHGLILSLLVIQSMGGSLRVLLTESGTQIKIRIPLPSSFAELT